MLPPIAPALLERNPKFKVLYEDISQNKLNSDASTKDVKRQRLVDEARKLHEVITIVAAQLNGHIPSSDREILQEDVEYFTEHIVPISRALSAHLKSTAVQLCRIASPETDPNPGTIRSLPSIAQDQQDDVAASTAALASHRVALADLAAATLDAQTRLVEVVVRVLEQTVHGSAARAARAKAEHLAAVAKGLELKLSVVTLTSRGEGELERAVEGYGRWLRGEREELDHRKAIAEDRLRDFEEAGGGGGGGKGGMLREIARRYAEVEEEIARVRGEVGRLEGS
ncbi:putative alpha-1,6-mannosyltransferase mnn11 [Diplodia intermedia]|uniref:Alpha-1,6-mannosyltransferase mnn11 n=1 Tax=Diplodia intermedia TaxID=856260 RepID=A0ABR3U1E4_9PEZI